MGTKLKGTVFWAFFHQTLICSVSQSVFRGTQEFLGVRTWVPWEILIKTNFVVVKQVFKNIEKFLRKFNQWRFYIGDRGAKPPNQEKRRI